MLALILLIRGLVTSLGGLSFVYYFQSLKFTLLKLQTCSSLSVSCLTEHTDMELKC
jgi:hypothetical protein